MPGNGAKGLGYMIQKIIAYLYQKKVMKTYNDNNDGFICNFVLEYKDKGGFCT